VNDAWKLKARDLEGDAERLEGLERSSCEDIERSRSGLRS
jgi:hypothetical protein